MATPRKANTTRRPVTRRTATVRRKQPAAHATLPNWLRNSLAVVVVLLFSAGFYYFSFFRMPIAGNPVPDGAGTVSAFRAAIRCMG